MKELNFGNIEKKWQKEWEKAEVFKTSEDKKKKKCYILEMYPYPSALGLHMGHAFNYSIGDVYARFKRMKGFNVLYPMGYDSFGLPAENAAIRAGEHPKKYTEKSIKNFVRQQKELGLSYDWRKILYSHDFEYYRWNQFFFLKFLEKGLAYKKKSAVNWCSKCNTVLANEQVHGGKCEYHPDTEVEIKQLDQWFVKTTAYAEELLEKIDDLDWPEKIKSMQKNWIGKSHGININFNINGKNWEIFTTRPDTIYGVTFMVISAQHSRLMEFVTPEQMKEVNAFLKKIKSTSERDLEELEKEGVFTGSYAINPITNEEIPVYAGNFVVADYGCGIVMAVPTHDQRDFEFAKKYNIPMKVVIQPEMGELREEKMERAYTGSGNLVNSDGFNGMYNVDAIDSISDYLEEKKLGKRVVQYKLRDWLISRQRYWGTPIPIIYCDKCGIVPVSEKDLPVLLPEKVKFGKGNPLATNKDFVNVKCPKCNGNARRETDTMDTFFDSSWYYLRFPDNKNFKEAFNKDKINFWLPVDQYIGGAEHACMHLIYARFFTKALRDFGLLTFDEPFNKLFNQGMLSGEGGEKMSKSKGNIINPDEISKKYGMDVSRFFLLSLASPDKPREWSEIGVQGCFNFLSKSFISFQKIKVGKSDERTESKLNKAIKEVTANIENFKYNMAIIKIREIFESLPPKASKKDLESYLKLLHPFCPHITEELWKKLGNKSFLSLEKWAVADEKKINEKFEDQDRAIEKLCEDINNISKIIKVKNEKQSNKAFIYVLPNESDFYSEFSEKIQRKTGLKIEIFSVSDKNKHDPENKSKKVKPNRPGIYLE